MGRLFDVCMIAALLSIYVVVSSSAPNLITLFSDDDCIFVDIFVIHDLTCVERLKKLFGGDGANFLISK